jgi:hypothetical protein
MCPCKVRAFLTIFMCKFCLSVRMSVCGMASAPLYRRLLYSVCTLSFKAGEQSLRSDIFTRNIVHFM